MKLKFYFLLILSLIYSTIWAQVPIIQWQKSLGGNGRDYTKSIRQTLDGGYILAGSSESTNGDVVGNHGLFDYWIVKMSPSGSIQWQKSLGGNLSEVANAIQQTSDGGYILAGYSGSNDGDVTGNHGADDYWIVKLDSSGNIQWQKSLGGSGMDQAYDVQQTSDGGYVVAGISGSVNGDVTENHGNYDYWIVKLDSSGNIQWQKSLGGTNSDFANAIRQTSDNGYIVAGYTLSNNGDVTINYGFRDYWIVKLDSSGNMQWQKSLGGSGVDQAHDVQQTQDGGYIVAGNVLSSDGDVTGFQGSRDYWIVKLDPSGNLQWQKTLGGTNVDEAYSISQTSDGGYIVGGQSQSVNGDVTNNHGLFDYWIVKLDSTGNIQWQKSLGGSNTDTLYSIRQTSDNGYIMAGVTQSGDGDLTSFNGVYDIWVVKLKLGPALGVDETMAISKPSLYPNPAKDFVNINGIPSETTISITDVSGKRVFSGQYKDGKINISHWIDGVYIIQARHKGKIILSEKLVIKKQ
ncbi:T9SS type A sorting domain-containing protein [Chryseobacterium indologenes]|uniref:T9SS type A sorting domain-containing protein n=1 Tax=Chryseobacterium indologenes TaxID=253 RepID=UPI000789A126|nr:T9SS type A sorting domain-containing protein [Chryseobacterium indologenes]